MGWMTYCLDKAEECDSAAEEAEHGALSRELRRMADDWREAAIANDNQPAATRLL